MTDTHDYLNIGEEALVLSTGRLGLVIDLPRSEVPRITLLDYATRTPTTYLMSELMRRPMQPGDTVQLTNPATGEVTLGANVLEIKPSIPDVLFIAECNQHIRPVYAGERWNYMCQHPWRERQINLERSRIMLRPTAETIAAFQTPTFGC